MGNYRRCECGRLYKPYKLYIEERLDVDPSICPSCNSKLDDEYKRQQKADQEKFVKSLNVDETGRER